MAHRPLFVGVDVHKDSIAVAYAGDGSEEPVFRELLNSRPDPDL